MLSLSACAQVTLLEKESQLDDKREALKSLELADVVRSSSRDTNYSGGVVEIQLNHDDAVAWLSIRYLVSSNFCLNLYQKSKLASCLDVKFRIVCL